MQSTKIILLVFLLGGKAVFRNVSEDVTASIVRIK
jgi:hypothetical protein